MTNTTENKPEAGTVQQKDNVKAATAEMERALKSAVALRAPPTEEETKAGMPGRLLPEAVTLLAMGIDGEPKELGLVKDYLRAVMELPEKPEDVVIAVDMRGMYEIWKTSPEPITAALQAAGKPEVLTSFEKKAAYDASVSAWKDEAKDVVSIIDTLTDMLKHARGKLTASAPKASGSATAGARNEKISADDASAFFVQCPYCSHVARARKATHAVSNLNKHILSKHPGEESVTASQVSVYQKDANGNAVYV